jgi:hypothetical protein
MQFTFGSGVMTGVRTDVSGTVTPSQFGTLQEGSIEFGASSKALFGQFQFPVAIARGTGNIKGKAKLGAINARLFNDLFFQGTLAVGHQKVSWNEGPSAIPGTPYQVTVVNSATWVADMGVIDVTTGSEMSRVASAPATGQYAVAAGVYTFAAADTTKQVLISYRYTAAASGKTVTITNNLLGVNPTFELTFNRRYNNKEFTVRLLQCVSTKLAFNGKLEDFEMPDFEFDAFSNASGVIGYISSDE